MALWQFDCYIIPKDRIIENRDIDSCIGWENYVLTEELRDTVEAILPSETSWSSDVLQFGKNDGTCIEFFMNNDKIMEINVRFDLRELGMNQLEAILYFINMINGKIYYEEEAYLPDKDTVIELFKNSEAGKFSMNQEEYFRNKS